MRVLRHRLLPVCLTFVAFGMYYGALAVSVADIEHSLGISHGVFGALLAVATLAGGTASALVSVRAHKQGSGRTMRETLAIWSVLLIGFVLLPANWILALAFIGAVCAGAAVDVAMNTLATEAVQGSPTGLLRVHATYNFGAAAGCTIAGIAVANAVDWRVAWVSVGVLCALLAFADWSPFDNPASDDGDAVRFHAAVHAIITERLQLVAIAFLLGTVVEGGIDAWGPLYLRVDLEAGVAHGALAAAAGYLIGCFSRLSLSTLSAQLGAKRCVMVSSGISAFGLLLIVTAPSKTAALVGLALGVGGITANWPLLMSYATEHSSRKVLITGGLSTAGYAGAVMSPAVLGMIGNVFGLRSSLLLITGCAVVVVLLVMTLPKVHST